MLPMNRREIVEREQRLPILLQAPSRLGVLVTIGGEKTINGLVGFFTGRCHPDLMQGCLGFLPAPPFGSLFNTLAVL